MFNSFVYTVLAFLVIVTTILFFIWSQLYKEREFRKLIAWSAIGDYCPTISCYSYTRELLFALYNAQFNEAIDEKYRFVDEDENYINEIIDAYQRNIMRSYFEGNLRIIKSKYAITGDIYFMFALYSFLSEHDGDTQFLGHDMRRQRVSCKEYGENVSGGAESIYSLSNFAIVFLKMQYITYMYCKGNKILNPYVPEWNEKPLKEILDAQQVQGYHI